MKQGKNIFVTPLVYGKLLDLKNAEIKKNGKVPTFSDIIDGAIKNE